MDWTPQPSNPQIFHITHVDNLPSIISAGCLWSDARRIRQGFASTNIGYSHIKARRLNRTVVVAAKGKLGDYVPFNFCPRSVMLYVVGRGHEGYVEGEDGVVHLVSSVGRARATGRPWCFTDRHADLGYAITSLNGGAGACGVWCFDSSGIYPPGTVSVNANCLCPTLLSPTWQ